MITELNFFFFEKYRIDSTFKTKLFINFLFLIKLFNCLNFEEFKPINSEGTIPTSDNIEYLPPI